MEGLEDGEDVGDVVVGGVEEGLVEGEVVTVGDGLDIGDVVITGVV